MKNSLLESFISLVKCPLSILLASSIGGWAAGKGRVLHTINAWKIGLYNYQYFEGIFLTLIKVMNLYFRRENNLATVRNQVENSEHPV